MTELLTAAQMRAIEQAAIESGEVTGLELMERAGRGVVEAVFEEWPDLAKAPHRAVVLCGPGNNGGDGFVVARLLKEWGWEVEVFLYGDPERLPPDAKENYERWLEMGRVMPISEFPEDEPELLVDALFGTGLTRPIEGLFDQFLHLNEEVVRASYFDFANLRLTCIDLPSGVCSDSGRILASNNWTEEAQWFRPTALKGQLTVTFHSLKLGHVLKNGAASCGKTVVSSIGLEGSPTATPGEVVLIVEKPSIQILKAPSFHKYHHGHALILSGPPGQTGAARLAARGALRIGAGLVTLGVPPAAQQEVASQITAIMLKRVENAEALADVLQDDRLNALCLGPALGLDERARELVKVALTAPYLESEDAVPAMPPVLIGEGPDARAVRSMVLDADALTLISRDKDLFSLLHPGCVLTPHAGEFARLFPDIAEKLNTPATKGPAYSKVDATREAAARAGCIVLFKGPDTVIAAPDGRCSINSAQYDRAAPWLATAGSGDVLAGFITGLLARGVPPMSAAETAAWLHVECALGFGPGLIAEDLPEELPKVFRALGV